MAQRGRKRATGKKTDRPLIENSALTAVGLEAVPDPPKKGPGRPRKNPALTAPQAPSIPTTIRTTRNRSASSNQSQPPSAIDTPSSQQPSVETVSETSEHGRPLRQAATNHLLNQISINSFLDVDSSEGVLSGFDGDGSDGESEVEIQGLASISKQRTSAEQGKMARKPEKATVIEDDDEGSQSESELPFEITFEISNEKQGIRSIRTVSSDISWTELQDVLAQMFNIHPSMLHAQYRLSTDTKGSLPFDLSNSDALQVLVDMVRRVIMPPRLASGKPSKRQRKAPIIQVTNKSEQTPLSTDKAGGLKSRTNDFEPPKNTAAEEQYERRKQIRQDITDENRCEVHSLPDKPVVCWKPVKDGDCYPVTETNLNYWAMLVDTQPEQYSTKVKPPRINCLENGPRSRAPGKANAWNPTLGYPVPMPSYPAFPPSFQATPWYGSFPYPGGPSQMPPWPGFSQPPVPPMPAIAPIKPSDIPKINSWLEYCDRHPDRSGDNLVDVAWRLEKESFRRIDQLVGTAVSVEKLSEWLGIGKGMAILLMKYAEEDLELVRTGKFSMDL